MRILGVANGHDAGAAIIEDGKVIAAVNEERLCREKLYWGPPILSIEECLRVAKLTFSDIDKVAFANLVPGSNLQRQFRQGTMTLKKWLFDFASHLGFMDKKITRAIYLWAFGKTRQEPEVFELFKKHDFYPEYKYIEHHLCHAASAYYTSQFTPEDKVLVLTTDGAGDGLCASLSTVNEQGLLERHSETSFFHSPASNFYSNVTYNLGFKPLRHEGKITGLAAHGDTAKTIETFRKYLRADLKRLQYRSSLGCYGQAAARKLHLLLHGHKREDIAAGVQKISEEVVSQLVHEATQRFGCDKVCLAGGLFANVRVNQVILELSNVKDIYIHPHMGDGGIAVGAALQLWAEQKKEKGERVQPIKMEHALLGASFTDEEIKKTLDLSGSDYQRAEDVETEIAKLLADGKVVARFNGAMEYGPRALCNRSIMYQTTDPTINDWLNKRLKRTEFMPFAPIIMAEHAEEYFKNYDSEHAFAAEFMTITYDVTEKCAKEAPAITHVDGTARPQVVKKEINPSAHKVLSEYHKLTGLPILINTSFNIHEEPIVCTPEDAIRAFKISHLDVLAIGNYLLHEKKITTTQPILKSIAKEPEAHAITA